MAPRTNEEAARYMQGFLTQHAKQMPKESFDTAFNENVRVRSATVQSPSVTAKAVFAFTIPPNYSNQPPGRTQTTQGGAVAIFFDITTSVAIIASNFSLWDTTTGVTRRLDITYFKPPVEGDEALVECEVLQVGKRLATVRGILRREKDGVVLATCQHDKYLGDKPHYVVGAKL